MTSHPLLDLTAVPAAQSTGERRLTERARLLREAHERAPDARLVHVATPDGRGRVLAFGPESPWHELLPPWQYADVQPLADPAPVRAWVRLPDGRPVAAIRNAEDRA